MSYLPQHGLEWQGVGTGRDWFALPHVGLGDALTDAQAAWVKDIAAYITLQRTSGKTDQQIANDLQTPATAKQFGYLGNTLPAEWINAAFASVTPAGAKSITVSSMSTGMKVAVAGAVVVSAWLLFGGKKR